MRRVAKRFLTSMLAVCSCCVVHAGEGVQIRTLSSRPDTVSGGDLLLQVRSRNSRWTARLNGRDVTALFHSRQGAGAPLALLSGLKPGHNGFEVVVDGQVEARVDIIDHPLSGPIFSGPHQEPFTCQTVANGLGPPLDADCAAHPIVKYYYKSTEVAQDDARSSEDPASGVSSGFKPYSQSGPAPTDMAETITSDGATVHYIVRREIGVINRAVFDIQLLQQPGEALPTPWHPASKGWNGRLIYFFGGGCGAGHHQGTLPHEIGGPLVAAGYAVAIATLSEPSNSCNDKLAAETVSMVKEHFIKEYGAPVHTIAFGGSTGASQEHLIAQGYPGLLDGLVVVGSFPDTVTADAVSFTDCSLLSGALVVSKQHWTEEQKTAVSGFATWRTCDYWKRFRLPIVEPRHCDRGGSGIVVGALPEALIYDRISNPQGARCDIYDNEINFLGRDSRTGFARRPLDNVGVQYGLAAFNSGKIDAEQFVELNERVGGYDEDGNFVRHRTQTDADTVRIAHEQGLILTGGGGLSQIPIIDQRSYTDDLADVHDRLRSFVTRARLIASNGNADNQVILVGPRPEILPLEAPKLFPGELERVFAETERNLVQDMDLWLDNIAADAAAGTQAQRVVRNKPAGLTDGCSTIDGERIAERATYEGSGICNQLYPPHGDPRIAAGGPVTDDILKCALKPARLSDYSQPLTSEQLTRLRAAFPSGVCDYSGAGQTNHETTLTWQAYPSSQ
jgi:hypothetical protein